jgi:hypothetical protein
MSIRLLMSICCEASPQRRSPARMPTIRLASDDTLRSHIAHDEGLLV